MPTAQCSQGELINRLKSTKSDQNHSGRNENLQNRRIVTICAYGKKEKFQRGDRGMEQLLSRGKKQDVDNAGGKNQSEFSGSPGPTKTGRKMKVERALNFSTTRRKQGG